MPSRSAIAVYTTSMRLRRHLGMAVYKQPPPEATLNSEQTGPPHAPQGHAGLARQAEPAA